MWLLSIGSRFTLHASSPRSVALTQLRFALLTVTSSQWDLHPQVYAHAGRTYQKPVADPSNRFFHGKAKSPRCCSRSKFF